jgi:hypothetical protein
VILERMPTDRTSLGKRLHAAEEKQRHEPSE